ncbi:bifunctional polysaccharide deacetylase/glycosyltransferase family 2 protein [Labedaea rhizosphaerae]|uniref:Cellulose synthase/poly-beta-1,6-N-acetylglucosamine synthase-like glycosyltransferase n=1 Tax=Labedaea rhizosphaerae TaxID=598644 RepID=A0A4R6SFL4_LABRH|nr:bifunctional polysaccharide deacetylase/glycosyltransferase family 2 protein [Labedaea rhizosphaerae]TDQ00415.1 cellulose synthase/poly-beta-1,6-N-acetylglucosamine synthase-like glycosyltransferase [Labedaea rhizosphaerae]
MGTHRKPPPPPRSHWLLLIVGLGLISGLLWLQAAVGGALTADEPGPRGLSATVPAAVRTGGPLIDARTETVTTGRPAARTIALTFDDGPDPEWTPRILEVLRRNHVHATFFVTGAQSAHHPELLRQIVEQGNELGTHTATHVDLRTVGELRTSVETRATDLILAEATGTSTSLVRMPYSAGNDGIDDASWTAIRRLGAAGKLIVMSTLDSEDWQRPGVARIVANATPHGTAGQVLLMHDGGGDRGQTVAALGELLPRLLHAGWRVDTVGHTFGAQHVTAPAGKANRLSGAVLLFAVDLADVTSAALTVLLVIAAALAAARTVVVLAATWTHVRRERRSPGVPRPDPVTVIVPAYNEEAGIEATVRSIVASRHPVYVVVVDDGSTDRTAEVVHSLRLPGVRLIRRPNAGKPAALNTGLAAARTDLVVMVDGDTVLDPDAVGLLAARFADPRVGAVSGNAKVANRGGLLGRWQHVEYVIGFNLDRRMYDVLRCMPTVPGAIGAFRRDAVLAAGGVPGDTLAEDTDLTMALQRRGWKVAFEQRAVAWTEAPATLGQLWKQRYRWCYGTLQAVWKHRQAVLERGPGGTLGRRGLPYLLLFQVLLPMLAPVVDVAVVLGLLVGDPVPAVLAWLGFLVLQVLPGVVAFRLDGERLGPLAVLPLQQFVYRQLMYLVVIQSVATAAAGAWLPWHKLDRTGAAAEAPLPESSRLSGVGPRERR